MRELKLLKDIDKFAPEDPYCMMDTLEKTKDKRTLNSNWYNEAKKRYMWIHEGDLKQEAINQIKYFRHNKDSNGFRASMAFEFNIGDIAGVIGWMKFFFNITEGDLK